MSAFSVRGMARGKGRWTARMVLGGKAPGRQDVLCVRGFGNRV